jgi:hypothetical protein
MSLYSMFRISILVRFVTPPHIRYCRRCLTHAHVQTYIHRHDNHFNMSLVCLTTYKTSTACLCTCIFFFPLLSLLILPLPLLSLILSLCFLPSFISAPPPHSALLSTCCRLLVEPEAVCFESVSKASKVRTDVNN